MYGHAGYFVQNIPGKTLLRTNESGIARQNLFFTHRKLFELHIFCMLLKRRFE